MTVHKDNPDICIESAEREAAVTGLLDCLLERDYAAADKHEGMRVIRKLLEGSKELSVPVVDLAAVLPDLKSHTRSGLHIASYYALDDREWYPELLNQFFAKGAGGSLMALKGFAGCVGKYRIQRAPRKRGGGRPMNTKLVPISDFFPPASSMMDSDVGERFRDYYDLLFEHFDDKAAVVWVCFGPRAGKSVDWAGSLFLVVRPAEGKAWRDEAVSRAVESVYSVLDASFHRAIVNSAFRQEAVHQLELTYFAFGHELKNRIDGLRIGDLSNKIHALAPKLIPDIDRCRERVYMLQGMAGVFSIAAKAQDGILPRTWVSASSILSPADVPTKAQCAEMKAALINAVKAYWHLEDVKGVLALRHVTDEGVTELKRPTSFQDVRLPPFNPRNPEPHLCFLSGLAEICRNAAKAVSGAAAQYDHPHIDFSVYVKCDASFEATVEIINPIVTDKVTPSKSVDILADLFGRLNKIVVLEQPAVKPAYAHALSADTYVRSSYTFFPKRIGVAAAHIHPKEAI